MMGDVRRGCGTCSVEYVVGSVGGYIVVDGKYFGLLGCFGKYRDHRCMEGRLLAIIRRGQLFAFLYNFIQLIVS